LVGLKLWKIKIKKFFKALTCCDITKKTFFVIKEITPDMFRNRKFPIIGSLSKPNEIIVTGNFCGGFSKNFRDSITDDIFSRFFENIFVDR